MHKVMASKMLEHSFLMIYNLGDESTICEAPQNVVKEEFVTGRYDKFIIVSSIMSKYSFW